MRSCHRGLIIAAHTFAGLVSDRSESRRFSARVEAVNARRVMLFPIVMAELRFLSH